MSDYGLNIVGSAGNIQIDSVYKNFVKLAAGSVGLTVGSNDVNITTTLKVPIIGLRPGTAEFSCHYGFTKSGSYSTQAKFYCGATSVTINWKQFVEGQVNALPAYGLIVNDGAAAVVFHSDDEPMNIVSVNTGSFAHNKPGGGNYSDETVLNADNNFFILAPIFPLYYETWPTNPSPPLWQSAAFTRGIKKINSTTIRVGEFQFAGTGGGGLPPAEVNQWINDYTLIEVAA